MKKLFSVLMVCAFVFLAGCVQPSAPQASPTPEFQGLKGFAQTPDELNGMKVLYSTSSEDLALLDANEEFLAYQQGVGGLNKMEFNCANKIAYQENLDQLQKAVDKGNEALPLIQDSDKKQYWEGFFFGMQNQKDSFQADLDEVCG
ncbi:MAG: hypothetical protein V1717_01740 [Candidatus Micrarchaeota archaeon]